MYEELLHQQSELVDNLDSDSLFDYLIQNGVLEHDTAEEIRHDRQGEEVNKALLEYLNDKEKKGVTNHHALFINGLRQTGHLQLANLLDSGQRIQPRRWNSLGYLNRTRHKGQVCLILQVNAVELFPDGLPPGFIPRDRPGGKSYWISLDELKQLEEASSLRLQVSTSQQLLTDQNDDGHMVRKSLQQLTLIEPDDPSLLQRNEKGFKWFNCCCFRSSSKTNSKKNKTKYAEGTESQSHILETESASYRLSSGVHVLDSVPEEGQSSCDKNKNKLAAYQTHTASAPSDNVGLEGSEKLMECVNKNSSDKDIRIIAETLHDKSNRFYHMLQLAESPARERLLTYFEQKRKILVLDFMYEDGIIIVCICTKSESITALQQDFESGQLVQDLECVLLTSAALKQANVQSMKLQMTVEEDEFSKALTDLQSH